MRIVLANWVWKDDAELCQRWMPPAGAVQSIDLRTVPQMANTVTPDGYGLFVLSNAAPLPAGVIELGSSFDAPLSDAIRRNVESALGLQLKTVSGFDIQTALWSIMTENADPAGKNGMRPKMPHSDGKFYLTLLGQKIEIGSFDRVRDDWVKANLRHSFAEVAATGGVSPRLLRWMARKYGFSKTELSVPSGAATLSESFDTADSDVLGPDQSWSETSGDIDITSNQSRNIGVGGTTNAARVQSDLDGADHFASLKNNSLNISNTRTSAAVRFAAGADTYYYGSWLMIAGGLQTFRIGKVISGTLTDSLATSGTETAVTTNWLRLEVVDDDLEIFYDDSDPPTTSKVTLANDTSITGGTRVGIQQIANGVGRSRVDEWKAGDLGVALAPVRRNMSSLGVGR